MNQRQYVDNPEMARSISENPVFSNVVAELKHLRTLNTIKQNYTYIVTDSIKGQTAAPYYITIEQGSDFASKWLTASAFSFEGDGGDATSFPIPNSGGFLYWAGRGLSIQITDSRTGRKLTSGFVPFELLATPGYGLNFQNPYPMKYLFQRNSTIQIDVRNRDNANRTHEFAIALNGFKIYSSD